MTETKSEAEIFEQLNTTESVRGFFITAVEVLDQAIDELIQRVFRKDDFAVQSVVEPLLNDSGPLGHISVRLKLLFGLGVLNDNIYHDIDGFIKLKSRLTHDAKEHQFSDQELIDWIKQLSLAEKLGPALQVPLLPPEHQDSELLAMQNQQQQQRIKSGLSLAIVDICTQLDKSNPL